MLGLACMKQVSHASKAALQEAEELKTPGVGKVFKTVDELREDLLTD